MNLALSHRPTWQFDLAAFVAILVTPVILISVGVLDPKAVSTATDIVAAYCVWRIAIARAGGHADRTRRVRADQ